MKEHAAFPRLAFRVINDLFHPFPAEKRFAAEKDDAVVSAFRRGHIDHPFGRIEGHIRFSLVYVAVGAGKIAAIREVQCVVHARHLTECPVPEATR